MRILSIDIFRGLTIFLMIFVNELAGVSGIPAWMKHVPAEVNGMTIVDVVFPAFLFIVGMAIPFAVKNRESKNQGSFQFWKHVIIRTLGLLILGVYMVNSSEMNTEATLIPKSLWTASLYIAAIMIWNRYPKSDSVLKLRIYKILKLTGLLILVVLYFLFRKGSNDHITSMTPSWWGILGLIGWAYFISIILYKISNKRRHILIILFLAVLTLLLVLKSDVNIPSFFSVLRGQTGHLAHASITMAGIICSLLLMGSHSDIVHPKVIRNMLILGIFLLVIGYFVQPFGGISKIAATPSWALLSAASCCLIFPIVYWLVDIKGIKNWANFLKPAGENPLLTYILPPLFYSITGYGIYPEWLGQGVPGFLRCVVFSLFILWISAWLTKRNVRLHL